MHSLARARMCKPQPMYQLLPLKVVTVEKNLFIDLQSLIIYTRGHLKVCGVIFFFEVTRFASETLFSTFTEGISLDGINLALLMLH